MINSRRMLYIMVAASGFVLAACGPTAVVDQGVLAEASNASESPEELQVAEVQQAAEPEADAFTSFVDAPASPESFRADSFEVIGTTGRPQVIEFFAYWCTVCNGARPEVHALEAQYWGEVDFVYLDIDDPANTDIKAEYGYTAQPFFVVIDADGSVVDQWFGYSGMDRFHTVLGSLE